MYRLKVKTIVFVFFVLFLLSRTYLFVELFGCIFNSSRRYEFERILAEMHPIVFYTDVFLVLALFFILTVQFLDKRK